MSTTRPQVGDTANLLLKKLVTATQSLGEAGGIFLTEAEANLLYQPLDADLTAISAVSTNGFLARIGAGTYASRTITGTAGQITVTNGDGVSGAPTISLPSTISQATTFSAGTASTSTSTGAVIISGSGGLGVGGAVNVGGIISVADNTAVRNASQTSTYFLFEAGLGATRFYNAGAESLRLRNTSIGIGLPLLPISGSVITIRNTADSNDYLALGATDTYSEIYAIANGSSVPIRLGQADTTGTVGILSTLEATTGGAGALVVAGGGYFAKALVSNSTTDASSTTTGSGIFAGGLGVSKKLYVGTEFYPSQTNGIVGTTTNNNVNAGSVGEAVTSAVVSGSAVALTTATTANVTSISLTAGDWDVEGNINYTGTAATVTALSGGITNTSATVPSDGTEVYSGLQVAVLSFLDTATAPRKRFSLSGTTTVYLVARSSFSAGTVSAFGSITARRVR